MIYLVDSAGARITDQVQMFPGRRGAGRIFYNEVKLSGRVPQVCLLFGPSAAGGAYIPAFCDVVIMREGNASMYLGSPRMAEMVIGEKVTPRGDGRGEDAHRRLGLRPLPGRERRGGDRPRQALPRPTCRRAGASSRRAAPPAEPEAERPVSRDRPRRREDRVRHQGADRARSSTPARSARCTRAGRRSWSSATRASTAARSGSSPTSRSTRAGCCSSTRPTRRRASS